MTSARKNTKKKKTAFLCAETELRYIMFSGTKTLIWNQPQTALNQSVDHVTPCLTFPLQRLCPETLEELHLSLSRHTCDVTQRRMTSARNPPGGREGAALNRPAGGEKDPSEPKWGKDTEDDEEK